MDNIFEGISIGVDIESNSRFKNLDRIKDKNFLYKIFLDKEIDYCFSKKEPSQHLAVRLAAKEATVKAISSLGIKSPGFNEIEVIRSEKGIPKIKLSGYDIRLSLSHNKDNSIAFIILRKVDR